MKLLKFSQPAQWLKFLSPKQRLSVLLTALAVIVILLPVVVYSLLHVTKAEAAWFDTNWSYRQTVPITNSGSAQTDYQIAITLDTATLITNGKMRSDCNDIRITDINGKLLPQWIETGTTGAGGKACNASTTQIWTKISSIPTSGQTIYLYYGNPGATNVQNGNKVFEFFDNFSSSTIDSSKWTQGTIGATVGTNFSQSGGNLIGGDTNRYIQTISPYNGDYIAETRINTTSPAGNGFSTVGFYASSSNSFGILDHNGTSYYRNDSGWVNFTYNGSGQWNRDKVKIVGTAATYWRTGETSGSATATGITNSGISGEYLRLGARYDDGAYDQNYSATWDWVLVRKTAATEPTVGSPTGEEVGTAPVAYWKFDEGNGTVAQDSSSNGNNGTLSGSTKPTWQSSDQCISGKCLKFDGTSSKILSISNSNSLNITGSNLTLSGWIKFDNCAYGSALIHKENQYSLAFTPNGSVCQAMYADSSNWSYASFGSYGSISKNVWHYVAVTKNSSNVVTIYVDGQVIISKSFGGAITGNSNPVYVGSYATSVMLDGFIDEPKIYSYARTAAQVLADFNSRGSQISAGNVLGASAYSNLTNGLVGYWKMDEATNSWSGTSGEVIDSSGNGNNGTGSGFTSSSPIAGKYGNGGNFNGSNSYVNLSTTTNFPTGSGKRTLCAWAKPTSTSFTGWIFASGTTNTGQAMFVGQVSGGTLDGGGYNGDDASQSNFWNAGAWSHVCLTYDGTTARLYGNGLLLQSTAKNWNLVPNVAYIGRQINGGEYWNGQIDDVRVYNRALSPIEVEQLYNFAPEPIAYWNFEEGSGTTVNDTSGNGLTASVNSGTSVIAGKYGKARQFTQDTDKISTSTTSVLNTDLHTISFWINLQATDGNWRQIMAYRSGTDRSPGIWVNPSNLCIHWRYDPGNTGVSCGGPTGESSYLTQNTWYYLTGVKNGNTFTFYVNGVQAEQVTVANPKTSGTAAIEIGQTGYSAAHMKIDEVKIYNYARNAKQIVSDMNAGHPAGGSPVGSAIGYWKFDEGYGGTTNNSGNGGNGLIGTITGSTWTNDGKFGKALNFNNTYVTVGGDQSKFAFTTDFSLSFWVNIDPDNGTTYKGLLGKFDGNGWDLGLQNGKVRMTLRGSSVLDDTSSPPGNTIPYSTWQHIVIVNTPTSIKRYQNGILTGTTAGTWTATTNTTPVVLGNRQNTGGTTGFTGKLDEVKIYNYALSSSEIKIDYNHGAALVLGAMSDTSALAGGSVASNSASAAYCVPGDTSTCNSPVGEWNFEEGQGSTGNDTSGNGNTGTLNANTAWKTGKIGKGLSFDGSGDYVSTNNTTSTQVTSGTMEAWIKTSNAGGSYRGIVVKQSAYGMFLLDNVFVIYDWAGGVRSTSINLADGKWHQVAVSFQSGTTNGTVLYIDGVATLTTTMTIVNQNQSMSFGTGNSTANGQDFNGFMDQVRLFNYVRSPAQVAYDYNRGAPVGHWKFDECQGTTAYDSSGFGNNGTITIGATAPQTVAGTCLTPTDGTGAWYDGASGKFNSSLNFDGADDYVSATDNNALKGGLTISTWYKASSTVAYNTMFNRGGQGSANGFVWFFFDNSTKDKLWYQEGNASYCSLKSNAGTWSADGQWHNLVASHNPTTNYITFYKDGNVIGGGSCTWRDITNSSEYIGTYNGSTSTSYTITGQLDDMRVYNYALTKQQIQQVYNQGASVRFAPITGTP